MTKELLLSKFHEVTLPFIYERNDDRTRMNIINTYNRMIDSLQVNGHLYYSLKKNFVDYSTPEIIDQGGSDIRVELIDGNVITIDEYCELLTNKEKYRKLLQWGINNFFDNYKY